MKVAVLSDIHANLVAFERVLADLDEWQPDRVVVAGDIVNRGPRPAECLAIVLAKMRQEGWRVVRGNHEDYVISQSHPQAPACGPAFEVHLASHWTYQKLGRDVQPLIDMPFQISFPGPDGEEFRVVHASMLGNRVGIYPETSPTDLETRIGLPDQPAVLCVGHTHRPLVTRQSGCLVVNAGSAGLPFDLDTRPSYARFEFRSGAWQAEIVRLDYDLQRAEQDFYDSGYLPEAGPLIDLVLIELVTARSMLYHWSLGYQARCLSGEISMEAAVEQFIQQLHDTGAGGE